MVGKIFCNIYYIISSKSDCFVDVVLAGHTTFLSFFIFYLCCKKALKWNVFTDASARRLVVGQGEPLCLP